MQTKDITVGAEYVVAEQWQWRQGYHGIDTRYGVHRVRVLATGKARRYLPRDSYLMRTTYDGVEVVRLDQNTGDVQLNDDGQQVVEVVAPRDVRELWSTFVASVDNAQRRNREDAERSEARRVEVMARITDVVGPLDGDDLPYAVRHLGEVHGDGSVSRNVRLSMDDVARLVEAAYRAGQASA